MNSFLLSFLILVVLLSRIQSTTQNLQFIAHTDDYSINYQIYDQIIELHLVDVVSQSFGIGIGCASSYLCQLTLCSYPKNKCEEHLMLNDEKIIKINTSPINSLFQQRLNSYKWIVKKNLKSFDQNLQYEESIPYIIVRIQNDQYLIEKGTTVLSRYPQFQLTNNQQLASSPIQTILDNENITIQCQFLTQTNPNDSIQFILQNKLFAGYAAIGINCQSMTNCNIILCNFNNSSPQCQDYFSAAEGPPSLQQKQNNYQVTGSKTSTSSQFTLIRPLVSSNPIDSTKPLQLIWAVGKADSLDYHENRGILTYNFNNEAILDVPLTSTLKIRSNFILSWTISGALVTFQLEWDSISWIGLGFGKDMTNTDMIVIQLDANNQITVGDYFSKQHGPPTLDKNQDFELIAYQNDSKRLRVRISRKLNTGDSEDLVLVEGSLYQFCYAFTTGHSIEYHGENHGTFYIPFSNNINQNAYITQDTEVMLDNEYITIGYKFETVSTPNDQILFSLQTKQTTGYIGLGINCSSMSNCNMVICNYNKGNPQCLDYFSDDSPPVLQKNQYNYQTEGIKTKTNVAFNIQRPLKSTVPIDTSSPFNFIWGLGATDELVQHIQRGAAVYSFKTQNDESQLDLPLSSALTIDKKFTLKWSYTTTTVIFQVELSQLSWVGLGFGSSMTNIQMVIGQFSAGKYIAQNYFSEAHQFPTTETSADFEFIAYSKKNNMIRFRFTRALQSSQKYLTLKAGSLYQFCYAYTAAENMEYHNKSKGIFYIPFDSEIKQNAYQDLPSLTNIQSLNGINIDYELSESDSETIYFKLTTPKQGYFGLGINCSSMENCNIIICSYNGKNPLCQDYESKKEEKPTLSKTQFNYQVSAIRTQTETIYLIQRPLNLKISPIQSESQTNLIWAIGENDNLDFHINQGTAVLNLKPQPNDVTQLDKQLSSNLAIGSQMHLKWTIDPTSKSVIFQVDFEQISWIAIGFNNGMTNTDMVIAQIHGSNVVVQDYYSKGHNYPSVDAQQDIEVIAYQIQNQKLRFRWTRLLNTGDTEDKALVQGETYTFCTTSTSSESIEPHPHGAYQIFQIKFDNEVNGTAVIVNDDMPLFLHKLFMYISWAILIDFAIIFARYCKTFRFYSEVHMILAFSSNTITIVMSILFILKYFNDIPANDMVKAHKWIGIGTLAMIGQQALTGFGIYYCLNSKNVQVLKYGQIIKIWHQIAGVLMVLAAKANISLGLYHIQEAQDYLLYKLFFGQVGLWLLIYFVLEVFKFKSKVLVINPIKNRNKESKYTQLTDDDSQSVSLNNVNKFREEKSIFLFKNQLVDVTKLTHPGGQSIIQECQGRDITRFIFGAYGLENTKLSPYQHSQHAFNLLNKLTIGRITPLQQPYLNQKFQKIEQVKLSSDISLFYFNCTNIANSKFTVNNVGQYYVLNNNNKYRMYTQILSMSQPNILLRQAIINGKSMPSTSQVTPLPLVIKEYKFPNTLSSQIHQLNDIFIEGPYGNGLELNQNSTGKYCAIVGGTGLLPFLDLIDLLFKKTQYLLGNQQVQHYQQDIKQILNDFEFTLYGSFRQIEDIVGWEWLSWLHQLNQSKGLKLFQMKLKLSNNTQQQLVENYDRRFDKQMVTELIHNDRINKIFICGPPAMQYELYIKHEKVFFV